MKKLALVIGITAAIGINSAQADQVILDDLIVDGSICVGMDCVNGESFGFDTIRLKENNLRIQFVDTSTTSSFPSRDWQITVNDSANGGLNKFSIDDIDGGRTPFTIEAGAPSHSLYVDDGGRLGLGTSTPVVDIHVKSGNTPTMRLEQDGSSGFTQQTWDVASNETNFFIRDATNGSTLPFRIRPGAPSSSIDIAASGNVGIGTDSPGSALHVRRTDGTAIVLVEEASGSLADRDLLTLSNNGGARMLFTNTNNSVSWRLGSEDTDDDFIITRSGSGDLEFRLTSTGDLHLPGGQVQTASDRNKKYNIDPVDAQEILSRLDAMPVSTWTYKTESPDVKHIGPMAQDFMAAFGYGTDERLIGNLDIAGVALAALKGLNQKVSARDEEIQSLRKSNEELFSRLSSLEAMVKAKDSVATAY